jgi:glycosyltransferase involved in cell wall biosynthesis
MYKLSVTVVIATFDRAKFLGRAIQSVVDQQCPDIEIIVVDDCSTDQTQAMVARDFPNALYFRLDHNRGCGEARNRGLSEATKSYVLILDDDDTLLPGALALIAARLASIPELQKYPVVNFARGKARIGAPFVLATLEDYISEVLHGDFIPLICRKLFLSEELMYPLSRIGGEHMLWWKIAQRYGIPTWADRVGTVNADAPVRLTSVRAQICHAREHAELQERTLKEFSKILLRRFPAYYQRKLLGAATYRLLAGDRVNARSHLRIAGKSEMPKKALALWVLSYLPLSLTRQCFRAYRSLSKVDL